MKKLIKGIFADNTKGTLLIEGGKIIGVNPDSVPCDAEILDFGDNYILPAFVDIHVHGGGGHDFIDNTDESFDAIFDAHLAHGTASICPTLCACDFNALLDFLKLCREKKTHPGFLGVHLEGPFLSPEMCGAQNLSCLRDPSDDDIKSLSEYTDVLCRITVAPELSGAGKLAESMLSKGVRMAVGHTATDAKGFYSALEMGFDSVTHLYSSMKGRYKAGSYVVGGLVEGALADDNSYVELIGDGHHVSRENMLLTIKCKGIDRVAIVSDAMRGAHEFSPFDENFGESFLGAKLPENRVIIEDGVAKLPDRSSFAGSIAVGDTMLKALVKNYGLPLETVSRMMSDTPSKLIGLSDRGRLEEGLRADITVVDQNMETITVLREGETVYNKEI